MTDIPAPVLFAIVVLIGWPLAQLVSVWFVGSARAEARALADELRRDPRFGEADRRLLDRRLAEGKGNPALTLLPILVPFGIVAFSVAELLGKSPKEPSKEDLADLALRLERLEALAGRNAPELKIQEDGRYRRLVALTSDIGILRWPISLLLTGLIALVTLPVYLLAYGLRSSWTAFVARIVLRYAVTIRFAHQGI